MKAVKNRINFIDVVFRVSRKTHSNVGWGNFNEILGTQRDIGKKRVISGSSTRENECKKINT